VSTFSGETILLILLQPDATTEEKRLKHQKELATRLNEEARERIRGLKSGGDEKKLVLILALLFSYSYFIQG
jgi:hypothetical protein